VERALKHALQTFQETPLYITFSGNGEPSMHPDFPDIVDRVNRIRTAEAPSVKTAILSNSSTAHIREVRDAILRLDVPIMKLDAGDPETFRKVNRPAEGVDFERLASALATMPNITIQTCLLSGSISNSDDPQIDAWIEQISRIRPKEVQVYTVDRPPADSGLVPVSQDRMTAIVDRANRESGVPVVLYGPRRD
jgi:wyosine [tRNA(Phe)-imidazoG37] synthetase (radical SAM superfamily)